MSVTITGAAGRRSSAGGAASCQVMSPRLCSVVSSTLVEGAPGATNLTRPALEPSPLHFHTPTHLASGELDSCELGVFRSHCFLLVLLRLIFNQHPQFKKKVTIKCDSNSFYMVRGRPHRVTLTVEGTVTRPDYVANRADQKNQGQFEDNICTENEK